MCPADRCKRITIKSKAENISKVVTEMMSFCRGVQKPDEHAIALSITEALANAIVHGNQCDPAKRVFVKASTRPAKLTIRVSDEGTGFDPRRLQDPTKKENLLKIGGRGIFFIRSLMDEVRFNKKGNEITMIKYLN